MRHRFGTSHVGAVYALLAALAAPPFARAQDTAAAALRLEVNLPAMRLDGYVGDTLRFTYPVAVGERKHPTPIGRFAISMVEWNPWWIPPAQDWALGEAPTPPGPDNPMGRVKLYFRPLYFLHGTAAERSIGTPASHGCVRLHNRDAVRLALAVLAAGIPGIEPDRLVALAQDTVTTSSLPLERPVRLDLVYRTVEARGDSLLLHPDIYLLGVGPSEASVLAGLTEAGMAPAAVDTGRVRDLVSRAGGYRIAVLLGDLRRPRF